MAWGLLLVTYALLPVFSRYRAYIAPASALLFAVPGILPVGKAPRAVNWNAIMMAAPIVIAISSNLQGAVTVAYVLLRLIGRPKG